MRWLRTIIYSKLGICISVHLLCRCKESSGCGGSSLNRTLRQLYAVGEPGLGRPGHIMYSDAPPIVDGLNDEDFFDFSFTQGKGVLVSSARHGIPLTDTHRRQGL